jgi:3',5'-cyclic AMP phosphodiesterase CpdA
MNVSVTLAHISDFHFGQTVDKSLLRQVERIVTSVKPDLLIVSGDLANHPLPWQLNRARSYLLQLARASGLGPDRILVVPGNHDYKFFGNFGLRRWTRIPFHVEIDRLGHDRSTWARISAYLRLGLVALWPFSDTLTDSQQSLRRWDLEELGLIVLGFNSTPLAQWFATGRVSGDQISAAGMALEEPAQLDRLKVAVVHHHPLPIPYVSTNLRNRLEESLMTFYNAGTFMRELSRRGIDIVLHGHRHFAGFTVVSYDFADQGRRDVGVLAAGSASHKSRCDPLGWNLNVVRVYDDEQVEIEQRYFTLDAPRADSTHRVLLRDLQGVAALRRRRLAHQKSVRLSQLRKVVRLTRDGYSEIQVIFEHCVPIPAGGIDALPLSHSPVVRPAYVRGLKLRPTVELPQAQLRLDGATSGLRLIEGHLLLGSLRRDSDDPFDTGYAYRLMNGHALDAAEFERKYDRGSDPWEFATLTCDEDAQQLELRVEFPDSIAVKSLAVDAVALHTPRGTPGLDQEHHQETQRIKYLLRSESDALVLSVPGPIPDFHYRIRWRYSPATPPEPAHIQRIAQLEELCRVLVEQARIASEVGGTQAPLQLEVEGCLQQIVRGLEKQYPASAPDEELGASLMVTEPRATGARHARRLRFVATTIAGLPRLFPEAMFPGEGCAGFAFEKRRVVFYNGISDELGYYISPDELARDRANKAADGRSTCGLRAEQVIFAIPLVDSVSGLSVGVISIGSQSPASRLLRFFGLSPEDQARENDRLVTQAHLLLLIMLDSWLKGARNGLAG